MSKTIFFDMDGTLANLYSVDNWLDKLRAYDPSPYADASTMLNFSLFARYLHKIQAAGWRIGIISWLSKEPTEEYDAAVIDAKMSWLALHLKSVVWDEIHIIAHGTPKSQFANKDDILFDDEEKNREDWIGTAYNEENILKVLKEILENG